MNTATQENPTSINREFKYRFKEDAMGNKRPAVSIFASVPTLNVIAQLCGTTQDLLDEKTKQPVIQNGKAVQIPSNEAKLILEAIESIIQDQIRSLVNDKEDINQENFPLDQATFEYIANMPPSARRGAGIPKEQWEEFAKNYVDIMPAVTGKTKEQCAQAAQIYVRKFRDAAGNLPVVEKLQSYLAAYVNAAGNKAEDFQDILEFLVKKSSDMLSAKDKVAVLENL